jgi:hypothetical protein
MSESTVRLDRIAILWRGEAARRSATPCTVTISQCRLSRSDAETHPGDTSATRTVFLGPRGVRFPLAG